MSYPNQPNQQPPQENYPNQPQYPQNPHGQPTEPPQGYPPNPYGQPQHGGYPPPQYGYPTKRNNTPLIIGGIVALIAIIAVVVFVLVSSNDNKSDIEGAWYNSDEGSIVFSENTWSIGDSTISGIFNRNGNILTLTGSTGQKNVFQVEIVSVSDTTLVLNMFGSTQTFTRQDIYKAINSDYSFIGTWSINKGTYVFSSTITFSPGGTWEVNQGIYDMNGNLAIVYGTYVYTDSTITLTSKDIEVLPFDNIQGESVTLKILTFTDSEMRFELLSNNQPTGIIWSVSKA